MWGQRAAELARGLLVAVAEGTLEREHLEALAAAVLDDELVRLALEVRAGGPHAVRRAIELAALLARAEVRASASDASS